MVLEQRRGLTVAAANCNDWTVTQIVLALDLQHKLDVVYQRLFNGKVLVVRGI